MERKFEVLQCCRKDAMVNGQSRRIHPMEKLGNVSDAPWRVVVFAVADIVARHLAQTRAGILVSLLLVAVCVLLLLLNRKGSFLKWFMICTIVFDDVNPQIAYKRSPFDIVPIYYSVHSFHIGPFTPINAIFFLVAFCTIIRVLHDPSLQISKRFVLMLSVCALRACVGVVNLVEDQSALRYYISDVGPLAAYCVYYAFTMMTVLEFRANPESLAMCAVDCLRGKALGYALQWAIMLRQGLGWVTKFAPDTLTFAAITCATMYPMIVGSRAGKGRVVDLLAALAGIMMFIGQPGSAQIVYIAIGFTIVIGVSSVAGRASSTFKILAGVISVAIAVIALNHAIAAGLVPVAPLIGWKLQNLVSLVSGELSPTVSLRMVELQNIMAKLRCDGILALVGGEGAGSYFEFRYEQPPSSIYEVAGAYSADQLVSGRIYRPHDFVNANLLKDGYLGLVLYLAFFIWETMHYANETIDLMKRGSIISRWGLMYLALLPGMMYNIHWSTKVATFSGVFSALACTVIQADTCKIDHTRGH